MTTRTEFDFMAKCVEAVGYTLQDSRLIYGNFSVVKPNQLELRITLDHRTAHQESRKFLNKLVQSLRKLIKPGIYAVQSDDQSCQKSEGCATWDFIITINEGQEVGGRLPLRLTSRCSPTSRLAPVLVIVFG